MQQRTFISYLSVILLVVTVVYSFYRQTPSSNAFSSTDVTQFSKESALTHLQRISEQPHYTGSKAHADVRAYIVTEFEKLGLEVTIQEQMAINKKWRAATHTQNILTRIKGSGNGKALLLLTHYDSSPHSSLGASDAGSGVVVILEAIRAYLAKGIVPTNDIVICITDAEELGLLGANAFVKNHPWASNVGLVLNFEARGSGGPSYMLLETNGGNEKLIKAFANAGVSHPVGNSLMYSIYKMLPNDTDLTVFREDGDIDGFNFAFIGDHFDYHTAQDASHRLDENTLNHQASYLVTLLDYFSSSSLNLKATEDFVFTDFPIIGMLVYPFSWALPMVVLAILLFVFLLVIGFAKRELTVEGIIKGFVPMILSLVVVGVVAYYLFKIILVIHPQYNDILHGFTYNGYVYIAAFTTLSITICFWLYKGFLKKRSIQDLLVAPLFLWLVINILIVVYLKGASFFILPVFVLLVIFGIQLLSHSQKKNTLLYTVVVIPILVIFAPLVKMFPVGLGLKVLFVSALLTTLLFFLVIPIVHGYTIRKSLTNLLSIATLVLFGLAAATASYSVDRKLPNSIVYVKDLQTNEAHWGSYNREVDEFTKQFLGDSPTRGPIDTTTTASKYRTKIKMHASAASVDLPVPTLQMVMDTIINNDRHISLQLISNRHANKIELLTPLTIDFTSFAVNGEAIEKKNNGIAFSVNGGSVMSYFITQEKEPITISFSVVKDQPLSFEIYEIKFDLLTNDMFTIAPRKDYMMPMPFVINDATILKTTLEL